MRLKRASAHAAEHKEVTERLDKSEARIVDMTARLVRLEAEIGLYHIKDNAEQEGSK